MPAADGARLARPVVPPRPLGEPRGAAGAGRATPAGPGSRSPASPSTRAPCAPATCTPRCRAAMPTGPSSRAQAVAAGAVAVLTDASGRDRAVAAGLTAAASSSSTTRARCSATSRPGCTATRRRELLLVGITGTNGKTTTAYLVDAGLRAAGHRTGLLGTVQTRVGDEVTDSARTTPEAPDLQALLALMVERGCTAAVLEVSSHALALGRVDGVVLDVAVFTNLSQDHLDFHRTIEDYFAAKARLFTPRYARAARRRRRRRVRPRARRHLRRADAHVQRARRRAGRARSGLAGRRRPRRRDGLDLRAARSRRGAGRRSRLQLPGAFNVANATVRARRPGHRRRAAARRRARRRRAATACPGGWSGSTPASRTSRSSTTRTRRTR